MLSENYVGHAQMCNLLGEWMSVLDESESSNNSTTLEAKSSSNSNTTTTTTSSSTNYINEANRIVEEHLKTLIQQHFEPKRADTIWGQKVIIILYIIYFNYKCIVVVFVGCAGLARIYDCTPRVAFIAL
jgi:hypothetical protein